MSKLTTTFGKKSKRPVDDYANMDDFLDDLVPEIKHWSEDLDEKEYYTGDFPWRELRDEEDFDASIMYFFKEESEFLYSINGNVQAGQWRHLQSNKLLLEKNFGQHIDSELYNMLYMNEDFFILEKPGDQRALGKSKYLVLVRDHKIRHADWRGAMDILTKKHTKGFGTLLIVAVVIAVLLIIYYSWR